MAAAQVESGIARTGAHPDVLQACRQSRVSIAIWQRRLPVAIQHRLALLCLLMPRHRMFSLAPDAAAAPVLDEALSGFFGEPISTRDPWRADLLQLLLLARTLAPQAALRVRIESKASTADQLFHVDLLALRLVCTYRGRGTQWLPEAAFDRRGLGRGGNDCVRDWSALQEIPTGAVAVMKGNRFPGQPGRGLVHRSPPARADLPRVLAVIDVDF